MMKTKLKRLSICCLFAMSNAWALDSWNPVDAGFYDANTDPKEVLRFFDYWGGVMADPDCAAKSVDQKNQSKHDVLNMRLGDVCHLPASVRAKVSESVNRVVQADRKAFKTEFERVSAQGKLKDWLKALNESRLPMLRSPSGIGWVTEELALDKETRAAFEISTFLPGTERAYISWMKITVCAASADDTLEEGSRLREVLLQKYGSPASTFTKGQWMAAEYEQKLVVARKTAEDKEKAALSDEQRAEVDLIKQEIKYFAPYIEKFKSAPEGKENPPMGYQWKYPGYTVAVDRAGECSDQRPRYEYRMFTKGAQTPLFSVLGKASRLKLQEVLKSRK